MYLYYMAELVRAEKELSDWLLKRSFLIGSLSGPNFPLRTAKMNRSRKDLTKSCF